MNAMASRDLPVLPPIPALSKAFTPRCSAEASTSSGADSSPRRLCEGRRYAVEFHAQADSVLADAVEVQDGAQRCVTVVRSSDGKSPVKRLAPGAHPLSLAPGFTGDN